MILLMDSTHFLIDLPKKKEGNQRFTFSMSLHKHEFYVASQVSSISPCYAKLEPTKPLTLWPHVHSNTVSSPMTDSQIILSKQCETKRTGFKSLNSDVGHIYTHRLHSEKMRTTKSLEDKVNNLHLHIYFN